MLRILLAKDLRRAWRNPLPWIINLIVPLVMTALIGLVFGGGSDGGALGRVRFAVVDEDKSVLSGLLRGAVNQGEGNKYLDPVFMERAEALREVNANKISAVLIIHTNFMRDYLTARAPVSLELIKNPAESIHPAVLEELLGAVVTAMNEISRNFNSEFPEWQAVFEGKENYHKVSLLIDRAGDKFKSVKKFLNPPLVGYQKEGASEESPTVSKAGSDTNNSATKAITTKKVETKSGTGKGGQDGGIFAYLLIGMSAMFLLFLGNTSMTDIHRELRKRTFERYQTMREQLWPFIVGKIIFTVVVLLFCSLVMLGGGGLIFRIQWPHIVPLISLTFGYMCFVAALFAVLVALVPDERRAGVLNNIASMALGLAGGCAFPPRQLPEFLRDHITPLLPSYWYAETLRNLECGSANAPWLFITVKLMAVSAVLVMLAGSLFRSRFKAGLRT